MANGQPGRPRKAAPVKATKPTTVSADNAPEVPSGPAPAAENTVPVETEQDRQIRELKEQLAQMQELLKNATVTPVAVPEVYDDKEGDTVHIHFVEDGLTAQGRSWYRGQEIVVVVGSDEWNDSLDRNGNSWLSLTESDQLERYSKTYFRRGPWPGKNTYLAGEFTDPKQAPPESELEKADRLERERRGRVGRLPEISAE